MEDLKRRDFLKRTALAGTILFMGQQLLTDGSGALKQALALVPQTTAWGRIVNSSLARVSRAG